MTQDYKSFLCIKHVSGNKDLEKKKAEVQDIAWLNFGCGERNDDIGQLLLVFYPESVFHEIGVKRDCVQIAPKYLSIEEEDDNS